MAEGNGQQRHWGKRLREDPNQVRFSSLTPEQKLQRRRQERQEKKERDRTLAYFRTVQRTMDEHARSSDSATLANIVDGFFGELLKLLKGDPSFHLLRNGVVCRAIESALGSAVLLQSKTLLYVFLGHVAELMASPVASYTVETLIVSISLGLSALLENNEEAYEAEMTEGGPGVHTGSGVGSTATLLRAMVDELTERMGDLLVHEVGARAVRSVILVLGGFSIRNAPAPARPVRHTALLGALAEAVVAATEEGYGREYRTTGAETWLAAAQTATTSFVLQSLLRVAEEGTPAYAAVVGRMEELSYKNKPLLWHLMTDRNLGTHLFQAYLRTPTPAAVVEAGDAAALRLERVLAAAPSEQRGGSKKGDKAASSGLEAAEEEALTACCWGKGLRMVATAFSMLLSGRQLSFILQDLALGAPTAAHLHLLWDTLLGKHLPALVSGDEPHGAEVLAVFARKCAFSGASLASSDAADAAVEIGAVPADINTTLRADEGQGVRYFSVSVGLQRHFCRQICEALEARALLVEGVLGTHGTELARCLLHLHPTASLALQQGIGALSADDIFAVAGSHRGSLVLQQYLRATSYWPAMGKDAGSGDDVKHAAQRFLGKIEDRLYEYVYDKYAAFIVETLYEVGSLEVKEAVIGALQPIYTTLKEEPEGADDTARRHVARKVLTKCCVEQHSHRRDDWVKLAQRQVQVQRLTWQMLLEG